MDSRSVFELLFEPAMWALVVVLVGYLLLVRGAFYLFASDSYVKSAAGGLALVAILAASLLLVCWVLI